MRKKFLTVLFSLLIIASFAQQVPTDVSVKTGASQTNLYLPLINDKCVGLIGNQTSQIHHRYLLDTILQLGISVYKLFSPEHGYRGEVEAGASVNSSIDTATGIPLISLYGNHKKPTPSDLEGVDVVVFDLQDVGVRFYTYISTLHYVMEACAENNIPLILLDRPNPNGYFIDGPILQPDCKSFVGMHPVPIVYGMTIGEYARMINGEHWLECGIQCELTVIPLKNYTHKSRYVLPVPPSPNLKTMNAVYLYPSLCLFEGTPLSVGRGTDFPFEVVGYPSLDFGRDSFLPITIKGKSENPKFHNQLCCGYVLSDFADAVLKQTNDIQLYWLIDAYRTYPDKTKFFTPFFDKLAGDKCLKEMIADGMSDVDIKKHWQSSLHAFKLLRKKYLIYPDFE